MPTAEEKLIIDAMIAQDASLKDEQTKKWLEGQDAAGLKQLQLLTKTFSAQQSPTALPRGNEKPTAEVSKTIKIATDGPKKDGDDYSINSGKEKDFMAGFMDMLKAGNDGKGFKLGKDITIENVTIDGKNYLKITASGPEAIAAMNKFTDKMVQDGVLKKGASNELQQDATAKQSESTAPNPLKTTPTRK